MFESFLASANLYISTFLKTLSHDVPRLTLVATLVIAFATVEFKFPAQRGQTAQGRIRNFFLTVLLTVGGIFLTTAATLYFPCKTYIRHDVGIYKSIMMVVAYLVVMDFFYYWYHRAQHTIKALWAMHAVHHSDEELNASSALRTYWLEMPLQVLFITRPTLLLLGIDMQSLLLVPIIVTAFHTFAHANIRLQMGFLTPLILGPQTHRIHHSVEQKHWDKNFCQFFPAWDILFGTYCAPEKDEFPETGTKSMASDISFKLAVIGPMLEWKRMLVGGTRSVPQTAPVAQETGIGYSVIATGDVEPAYCPEVLSGSSL